MLLFCMHGSMQMMLCMNRCLRHHLGTIFAGGLLRDGPVLHCISLGFRGILLSGCCLFRSCGGFSLLDGLLGSSYASICQGTGSFFPARGGRRTCTSYLLRNDTIL
uniref:Uncharacterized protein n=1 Tax=Triticum urartu TaxID=4572 RepID=A0A8R7QMX7_TRIUA